MLFYGDGKREMRPREALLALAENLRFAGEKPPGIARRARLVGLLVEAGELAQGLLDASFEAEGADGFGEAERGLAELLVAVAREALAAALGAGRATWSKGGSLEACARVLAAPLPEVVTAKVPEGFAHYGLYPELYALAARADLEGRRPEEPRAVLGLRSIGATLGAVVAAAWGAPLATLRPSGHPFAREVRALPSLEAEARSWIRKGARLAVVDEGPGLSGSSFGSAASWLESLGAPEAAIVFFPGHAGEPGPAGGKDLLARYRRAPRRVVAFEDALAGRKGLLGWVEACLGTAVLGARDLGAGRWREACCGPDPSRHPPAIPHLERRKYLVSTEGGELLLRFAGLGRYGERLLERAGRLAEAGFCPRPLGLVHGFLALPWLPDARPLSPGSFDRAALLAEVARYLAFLLRAFPARAPDVAASPAALLEMARHNARLALGPEASDTLASFAEDLSAIASRARPLYGDSKLQLWEWIGTSEGRLYKADALDHHAGHDLVGAQDLAWDFAGAAVELDLSELERGSLLELLAREASFSRPRRDLLFYEAAYLAFQIGRATLGASALPDASPDRPRLALARERYEGRLRALVARL